MTTVSRKTPVILIYPCLTWSSVFAAAAVIPAAPSPASLEKIPLDIPQRIESNALIVICPKIPPLTAPGQKAAEMIPPIARGMFFQYRISTAAIPDRYKIPIKGTRYCVTFPITDIPPSTINTTKNERISPDSAFGT